MQTRGVQAWLFATAAVAIASGGSREAEAAATAPDSTSNAALEEIVVTAQRRVTPLQETPLAVTAVSSEALTQANIATTQDLMQVVPGLQVSTQTAGDGGGSATFFLRGMGQQRSGNGSEPAVGIYVDDFYYPSLEGSVFDIVDLSSVEVLRGPQGTLFGRNTIGGAIRYTTQQPVLGFFDAHANATYGSFDRNDITGTVNVPFGDNLAVSLTGGHLQRDGFVKVQSGDPDAGGTHTDLARLQVKFQPNSQLTINLAAMWDRFRLNGFSYDLPGPLTPVPGPSLPFVYNTVVAPALGLPLYTNALRSTCFYCQPGPSGPEFSATEYENTSGTLSWDVAPWLTVKSLSGWQKIDNKSAFDLSGTPLPLFYSGTTQQDENVWSQEFQFSGKALADRLNFVSGLFYYHDRKPPLQQVTPGVILAAPGVGLVTPDQTTRSHAAYVDLSFKITDQLTLLGGYRYSADDKSAVVAVPGSDTLDLSKTFVSNTWRAGLQYQWTADVMTYFTASTGFRAGGFNPYQALVNDAVPFDPEKVTSYEIGARMQFLDRKLTLNPTAFYYDWNKIQVQSVYFPPGATAGVVVLQNAGAAVGKGFELEWSYDPLQGLRFFGNLATLDLHYTSIGNASGITVNSPLERAPKLTYSVGTSYTFKLQSAGDITTSWNYSHEGAQNSTPTDVDTLRLPAYQLLNGRVEWWEPRHHYSIALFATNLADAHYYVGGVNYYSNVGAAHYDLGRPREFGVSVRANY